MNKINMISDFRIFSYYAPVEICQRVTTKVFATTL